MNISDLEKAIAIDSITKQDKQFKLSKDEWAIQIDEALYNRVIRSFSINRFGVWNCDKPLISPNNSIPIIGKYVDSSGKDINLRMVAVVCPIFNSVGQFPGQWPIQILLGEKNMLWSIRDESFYYFTYNDFDRAGFNWNSKSYVFNMRKADEPIISYEQIKRLVDKM